MPSASVYISDRINILILCILLNDMQETYKVISFFRAGHLYKLFPGVFRNFAICSRCRQANIIDIIWQVSRQEHK